MQTNRTIKAARSILFASIAVLATATIGATASADSELNTERRVRGVITEIEGAEVTIDPTRKDPVTGRVDPRRTRVTVNGHAARPADLRVTYNARGEIGLDEVWLSVEASTR